MSGQHVGGVNDLPPLEEPGGARAAMARVMKPAGKAYSGGGTTGDGDRCPLVPEHGIMLVLQGTSGKQHCPHQSHDGTWSASEKKRPPTRSIWPTKFFAEAVAAWKESHA